MIRDIKAGTDRIEVPLYGVDENKGVWINDGEAYLENGAGAIILEDKLASIRDRSFLAQLLPEGTLNISPIGMWIGR